MLHVDGDALDLRVRLPNLEAASMKVGGDELLHDDTRSALMHASAAVRRNITPERSAPGIGRAIARAPVARIRMS